MRRDLGTKPCDSRLRKGDEAGGPVDDKKIGAESSDPNRHSQPRLPGSVVGEPSMRHGEDADKITRVIVL